MTSVSPRKRRTTAAIRWIDRLTGRSARSVAHPASVKPSHWDWWTTVRRSVCGLVVGASLVLAPFISLPLQADPSPLDRLKQRSAGGRWAELRGKLSERRETASHQPQPQSQTEPNRRAGPGRRLFNILGGRDAPEQPDYAPGLGQPAQDSGASGSPLALPPAESQQSPQLLDQSGSIVAVPAASVTQVDQRVAEVIAPTETVVSLPADPDLPFDSADGGPPLLGLRVPVADDGEAAAVRSGRLEVPGASGIVAPPPPSEPDGAPPAQSKLPPMAPGAEGTLEPYSPRPLNGRQQQDSRAAEAAPQPDALDQLKPRLDEDRFGFKPLNQIEPVWDYLPADSDPVEAAGGRPYSPQAVRFPEEEGLPVHGAVVRNFEPTMFMWAASNLYHNPLYFEDAALERYGHTYGPVLQPVASLTRFSIQLVGLPYFMALDPCCRCQYTLGWYRPGECAPKKCYHIPFNPEAAVIAAGVYTGFVVIIP